MAENIIFSSEHNEIAAEQGWVVSNCLGTDDEWRLERLDEAGVFSSDYDAMDFVIKSAESGSVPAQKAIEFLVSVNAKDAEYLTSKPVRNNDIPENLTADGEIIGFEPAQESNSDMGM